MTEPDELREELLRCRERLKQAEKRAEEALERVTFLTEIIDSSENIVILVLDSEGRVVFSNRSLTTLLGLSPNKIMGETGPSFAHPEDLLFVRNLYDNFRDKPVGSSERWRMRIPHKNGQWHDVDVIMVNKLEDPIEGVVCFLRVATAESGTIDGRQNVEEALRTVINGVLDAIVVHDLTGNIVHANRKFLEMFQIPEHEMWRVKATSHYLLETVDGDSLPSIWREVLEGGSRLLEWKATRPSSGEPFDVELFLRRIDLRGGRYILASIRDISHRKQAEAQIQGALREKEVLLREIHHRVKNNLQVMSSLFRLQCRYAGDEAALSMFRDAESRIRSMALVHEHLYRSEDLGGVRVRKYIEDLVSHLLGIYASAAQRVQVSLDIEEAVLDPRILIPLGFIVCELFGNSVKYAFPDARQGRIEVSLHRTGVDEMILRLRDNGIGTISRKDFETPNSLGLRLVKIFTEQLEGVLDIGKGDGAEITLRFSIETCKSGERVPASMS